MTTEDMLAFITPNEKHEIRVYSAEMRAAVMGDNTWENEQRWGRARRRLNNIRDGILERLSKERAAKI